MRFEAKQFRILHTILNCQVSYCNPSEVYSTDIAASSEFFAIDPAHADGASPDEAGVIVVAGKAKVCCCCHCDLETPNIFDFKDTSEGSL